MSNQFHSKYHRHNHHSFATSNERDSSRDPIASPEDPFLGSFHIDSKGQNALSGTEGIALSASGAIVLNGSLSLESNGLTNSLTGANAAIGTSNTISNAGNYNLLVGTTNSVSGSNNLVVGSNNEIDTSNSVILGSNNVFYDTTAIDFPATPENMYILGNINTANANNTISIGFGNVNTAENALILGNNSTNDELSPYAIVMGTGVAALSAAYGVAIGSNANVLHDGSIVMSTSGFSTGTPLTTFNVESTDTNQIVISAANGVYLGNPVNITDLNVDTIIANYISATEIHSISSFTHYQDIIIYELSGFEVTGDLIVNGDVTITDCLSVDCIHPYTTNASVSVNGNIDMMGYSISGIGNDSLSFESGAKISSPGGAGLSLIPSVSGVIIGDALTYNTASLYSFAHGTSSAATGPGSHAEGAGTLASGNYTHAEGTQSTATGDGAHAEGWQTIADGIHSHTEGWLTYASTAGAYAHTEGYATSALASQSHAEGNLTITQGQASHAEGAGTTAWGRFSHTEGIGTITLSGAQGSHTEGYQTSATDWYAHAEGVSTVAAGSGSHSEGYLTSALGDYSHVEGYLNEATGYGAHAEGASNKARSVGSHAEGAINITDGQWSHAEGRETYTSLSGWHSHTEGFRTSATDWCAHAEGYETLASGYGAHAEGQETTAEGMRSHAEGILTTSKGLWSHAEGTSTTSEGWHSHAEGSNTIAKGWSSHAEGESTITLSGAQGSHTEGYLTSAAGLYSHAEGSGTLASGNYSHASGRKAVAAHDYTFIFSTYTSAVSTTNSNQFLVSAEYGIVLNGVDIAANGDTVVGGNISTTNNISAGFFYGDGSNLTGITAGGGVSGASEAWVQTNFVNASGDIITGDISTSGYLSGNIIYATGGSSTDWNSAYQNTSGGSYTTADTLDVTYTPVNYTATTATVSGNFEGVSNEFATLESWTQTNFVNVSGDLTITGPLSSNSSVSATAFYGDGSNLTNIVAGGGSDVSGLSANWQSTYTTVSSNSANWDTAYQNTSGGSYATADTLDVTYTPVNYTATTATVSGNFEGVSNEFATLESWTQTNFVNVSGDLTITGPLSSNSSVSATAFYGDGSNLTGLSAVGGGSDVSGLSANWQSTYTTVSSNSANWDTAYQNTSGGSYTTADTLDVTYTPVNYTATTATVSGNFEGVSNEFATLESTVNTLTGDLQTQITSNDSDIGGLITTVQGNSATNWDNTGLAAESWVHTNFVNASGDIITGDISTSGYLSGNIIYSTGGSSTDWNSAYQDTSGGAFTEADDIDVNYIPVSYTATTGSVSGHFDGISNELGTLTTIIQTNSATNWDNNRKLTGQSVNASIGQVVYLSGADAWAPADASDVSTSKGLLGIMSAASEVLTIGTYVSGGGLTPAGEYYISETAGGITTTAPTTSGTIVRVVGYALNSTDFILQPGSTYIENA